MANKDKKAIQPQQSDTLSPFEEMERWYDEFIPHQWMHPFKSQWPAWPDLEKPFKGRFPKVDLIDHDMEILVRVELPGVKKEDIDVSMTDDTVTLKAKTKYEKEDKKGDYYRREISQGEFQRTLTLPDTVDSGKVRSNFKDGVLQLTIPKIKPAKRQSIKVN